MITEGDDPVRHYLDARTFAECVARTSPDSLGNLLASPGGSFMERRAAATLLHRAPGCSNSFYVVSMHFLRGAAAETSVSRTLSLDANLDTSLDDGRVERYLSLTPAFDPEMDDETRAISQMARCQVASVPSLAQRLLAAEPSSAEEGRWRVMLQDIVPQCGTFQSADSLVAVTHRAYLAEAFYYWTLSGKPDPLS